MSITHLFFFPDYPSTVVLDHEHEPSESHQVKLIGVSWTVNRPTVKIYHLLEDFEEVIGGRGGERT